MNVSVIVPAYNAQGTIGQTLKALAQQDYAEAYEVIVVDDGSTDQTVDIVRSFAGVKYFYQLNAGPAAARNRGAEVSQAQFLAFTDSDCVPHPDWLSSLMRGFLCHDVAVVMGGYGIANPASTLASCVYQEIAFRHKNLLTDHPKVFGSYNFCVKKSVFDQAGGFDTRYRNASGEDNDLSYKIVSLGHQIYFERKALVDHYHPTQVKKYLKEQFRHGVWRVTMYVSHPLMAKGDGYTFWKDIIEVPWSFCCILGLLLTPFFLFPWAIYLVSMFLIFEIYFAHIILKDAKKELFWGFIMFLRSFSRAFGLSTGILWVFCKKILNKS